MKVDVFIVLSPKFPGRAFVSAWPPLPEAQPKLVADGCEIWRTEVEIPTQLEGEWKLAQAQQPTQLRYVGRRLRNCYGLRGVVVSETSQEVVVKWDSAAAPGMAKLPAEGTFFLSSFIAALEGGSLQWESEHEKEEQGQETSEAG